MEHTKKEDGIDPSEKKKNDHAEVVDGLLAVQPKAREL